MLVGAVVNGKRYSKAEYTAVAFITLGVMLFSLKPAYVESLVKGGLSNGSGNGFDEVFGLLLAGANLLIDGFTNAEQVGDDRYIVADWATFPFHVWVLISLRNLFCMCRTVSMRSTRYPATT